MTFSVLGDLALGGSTDDVAIIEGPGYGGGLRSWLVVVISHKFKLKKSSMATLVARNITKT